MFRVNGSRGRNWRISKAFWIENQIDIDQIEKINTYNRELIITVILIITYNNRIIYL